MFAQCFLLIVLSTFTAANDDGSFHRFRGHIIKTNDKYEIITALENSYTEPVSTDNVLATGHWDQTYNATGWSVLEIKTFENQTNIEQVYGAGLLEGQLTRDLTDMQWQNEINDMCLNQADLCDKLKQFFVIQLDWIYTQIDSYPNDEYWHHINLVLIQLNGLIDGNKNTSRGPRKEIDDPLGSLFLLQAVTSIGDLSQRFSEAGVEKHDRCSALIKLLPDNKDIFVSHATWEGYGAMLKVIKRYTIPLRRTPAADSDPIPAIDTTFSSYAGRLHSADDFYMTKPVQMTIMETTINYNNSALAHNILPISVPEWMRIIVANRLSNSGKEWIDKFFLFNDGTYNNQWMISDFKQFTPGSQPKSEFLTVAEQMVSFHQSVDMTTTLIEKGYWASYNNIYFPDFRIISGEDDLLKEKGPELYSWANSSRARIFARDQHTVVNLTTMIHMMRYNNFTTDELSRCNCTPAYSAILTIAGRGDLNVPNGIYPDSKLKQSAYGATDAKIVNYDMMQNFSLVAIAGPTNQDQPPFVWSNSTFDKTVSHVGHPDKWDFKPFTPTWRLS